MQPLPAALRADMSKGYHYRNGRFDAFDFEWAASAPAAPIRGTATDLAQFMIAHLNDGCVEGGCILRPETVAVMHRQQFTHHPALTGMAYGLVESQMNGQRVLWHMGKSARFVTVLALLPQESVGLLVSYNTPPVDGREILFRFLDEFYPVDRPARAAQSLPGWTERARKIGGAYIPSRVALHSPQKIIGWLGTLPVRAAADGTLALGAQRYAEVEPWLFDQQGGTVGCLSNKRTARPGSFGVRLPTGRPPGTRR
jgi:CubicO group peptidase (beta-lactamase class C family)